MIQKIIDIFYRQPQSKYKTYKRFGGYLNYKSMQKAKKEMQLYSADLPPVTSHIDGLPIFFLTGRNYLYQTLFCIQSLSKASRENYHFTLVDDGSFDTALIAKAKLKLPGSNIVLKEEIEQNLKQFLPIDEYPYLHHKRNIYPHIKKLTDVHTIPGKAHKLVMDSDMLFWSNPKTIIDWLKNPNESIFMKDCIDSYGYSRRLMEELSKCKIYDLLNVGVIGLETKIIDWCKIENWICTMEAKEGTSYFLEQAISAMIVGNRKCKILPADTYIVNPEKQQCNTQHGILHHYVDLSKENYFKWAWKQFI